MRFVKLRRRGQISSVSGCDDLGHAQEVFRALIISGCDGVVYVQAAEKAFDVADLIRWPTAPPAHSAWARTLVLS
jgi:hypothetical protein